ncbi:hypothetical protein [Actinomadura harenae]|uniref:Uncharacterized protein n=1 Tax=Actinomadura harenae TaxID=2483351 RepID=A0A3M2LUF0_9ACTN|nr:hypothetical protein [Actinomadura harenae]RMI41109.1 hypothetical protein EBO15_24385 [Actinomadura harenae]
MSDVELARDLADSLLLAAGRPRRALAPPGPGAASRVRADCALRAEPDALVRMRLRFLHFQARRVEPDGVADCHGIALHPGDEAVAEEIAPEYRLADLLAAEHTLVRVVPARRTVEPLVCGRVVRSRWPIHVLVRTRAEAFARAGRRAQGLTRLSIEVLNVTDWPHSLDPDDALRRSLLVPHLIVALDGAVFVPPDRPRERDDLWPVLLAGDLLLASPVPLPDRPDMPITGRRAAGA